MQECSAGLYHAELAGRAGAVAPEATVVRVPAVTARREAHQAVGKRPEDGEGETDLVTEEGNVLVEEKNCRRSGQRHRLQVKSGILKSGAGTYLANDN